MTKFTTTLPADYDTTKEWFFVWHTPDPDATTTGPAWDAEGKHYLKIQPDSSRIRGTGNPVPGYMLPVYKYKNDAGEKWGWMPMTDFAALLAGQPEQGATGDSEVVRLRELAEEAISTIGNHGEYMATQAADLREKLEARR